MISGPNKSFVEPLATTTHIAPHLLTKVTTKLGFDEIYIINLERRADRKNRISATMDALGLSYKVVKAVDGKLLTLEEIDNLDIEFMPNYADPYLGRTLTLGEVGCFLSHYYIWEDVRFIAVFF